MKLADCFEHLPRLFTEGLKRDLKKMTQEEGMKQKCLLGPRAPDAKASLVDVSPGQTSPLVAKSQMSGNRVPGVTKCSGLLRVKPFVKSKPPFLLLCSCQ